MNRKIATSLICLLAVSMDSQAGFQITLRVGNTYLTIADDVTDDDFLDTGDTDPTPGSIAYSNASFGPTGMRYNFNTISATYAAGDGLDGQLWGMDVSVFSIRENTAGSTPVGTVVSLYTSVNDLSSLINEPAAASANITIKGNTGNLSANRYTASYDTRYSSANQLSTSVVGTQLLAGSSIVSGTGTYGVNIPDTSPQYIAPYDSSTFGMGILMETTAAWEGPTAPTSRYNYNFNGSLQIQQVPEPSNVALPVGIAAGLIALRRRRVTR